MAKIRVSIEGYGTMSVKVPKKLDPDLAGDLVANTVQKTMSLVDARKKQFHPVLGVHNGSD